MDREDSRITIAIEEAERSGVLTNDRWPILVGAGDRDDCAVINIRGEYDLVIGSDFVRGTGFYLSSGGYLTHQDIGWYLVAANISDLASMGASPVGIVVANRYDSALSDDDWRQLCRGVSSACREFSATLLGGDSGSYSVNVSSAAAIGMVRHGRSLNRANAKPGDRLCLTGPVGTAGAALAYYLRGKSLGVSIEKSEEDVLLSSWKRPIPAVRQGVWLAESSSCTCAIDTSDGLKAAVNELCARSKVDAVIDISSIPTVSATRAVAAAMNIPLAQLALSDSVDFRLLFCVDESGLLEVKRGFSEHSWELHCIGQITDSQGPYEARAADTNETLPGIPFSQQELPFVDQLGDS